jgi:L-fucose isomerase-like protein
MSGLIPVLDTTPCLLLSLLNDEGVTAFCHADYSHTPPGVFLRWLAGKPPFLCNTHFPHDGLITLAHCAAPRRMNGRDLAPARVMTHFESDYGAATKVEYERGAKVTVVLPSVDCSRWQGFAGTILESPGHDACRSQMEVRVLGNFGALVRGMRGFHGLVVYGDYLREIGYALARMKIGWDNFSAA